MMYRTICIVCIIMTLQSCLRHDINASNQETFQYVWDEFDQNYGGFIPRAVNWDSVYLVYQPKAALSETESEIFDICSEMIDILNDQHVSIYSNNLDRGFASGKEGDEIFAEAEFDNSVVVSNYLEDFESIDVVDEKLIYGKIKDNNLGYIHIPNFGFDEVRWFEEIDDILMELVDTDGLIIDVRNNGGGSPLIDRMLARRFALEDKFVFSIQTRNGPAHTDFDDPTDYFSTPAGDFQYTKSTIILINHSTVSAGEEFVLLLQTQSHITVVGDTTSNAFSTVPFTRLLPNGWELSLPNQLYLYPDGTSPEGVGVVPDVFIKNDSLDVQNGIDEVLEKAIDMF